jgi:SAM-dependent methyltransferase
LKSTNSLLQRTRSLPSHAVGESGIRPTIEVAAQRLGPALSQQSRPVPVSEVKASAIKLVLVPSIQPEPARLGAIESHQARGMAESFGLDPERYDRTRPGYPQALIERIVAASPGPEVVDVGTGTGISARQFRAAGCRVLGVEVDARMAEFARRSGIEVEVAKFEDWEPAGRMFDAVVAGQTWHWIEPTAGAGKAAEVLRPAGRLAVFWNVFEPPSDLAAAIAEVYQRVLPDSPFARGASGGIAAYARQLSKAADGIHETGHFQGPERWELDWQRDYTRDEWLDQVPTSGGHSLFEPQRLHELLAGIGAAIDAVGGSFTMHYTAVAITAVRRNLD